jgi:hypothetical protein
MGARRGLRLSTTFFGLSLYVVASTVSAATSLITNGTFDTNLAGWSNLFGFTSSWSALDAGSSASSGSVIALNELNPSNGGVPYTLSQCIPALPSTGYVFGGQALVPAEQPAGTRAHIFVHTFASGDCSGSVLQSTDQGTFGVQAWEWLARAGNTTPDVHSILVSFGTFKPNGETAPARVHFDNVFLYQGDAGFALGPTLSGSWYNRAQSGHGIMLDLVNPTTAWMCWFAFDLDGNRAWICGTGTISGNTIEFANAITVEGGKFPPLFNQATVTGVPWGSIYVTFAGCRVGSMLWLTNAAHFQSGSMPLERVTELWGLACP